MENGAQEVLDMEKMGQAGPEVAGEALERTGSWGPRIVRSGKPRDLEVSGITNCQLLF